MRPIVYLDHHATTPCDPVVLEAMWPWFHDRFGNAGSRQHTPGLRAHAALKHAREQVAASVGAQAREIVFTSGATEANHLAILGAARAAPPGRRHVVTLATEHKAVLDPVRRLLGAGFDATILRPGPDGRVDPAMVLDALRDDTLLVSVMLANNEIGVLQDVAALGAACRAAGVLLHTDATQAVGRVPVDVGALGVDLMSWSSHKIYGPPGIGALFVRAGRPRVRLRPLQEGGGQERGLRSGTVPVPLAVGFGLAATRAAADVAGDELKRQAALRDRLWAGLRVLDDVQRTGDPEHTVPNNLHVTIGGITSSALMMAMRDVAVSSGSACSSDDPRPSHVLTALGVPADRALGAIRFGLGRSTREADVDRVIEAVTHHVQALRAAS